MRLKFAVLGANSFSGTAFIAHAACQGHEVMPLRRPWHDINTRFTSIVDAIAEYRPDYFVNFAALNMVGESWDYFDDYYRTNVLGIARLADVLRKIGCLQAFVQVSTPEVYGATHELLREDHPFRPSTPYAISRACGDLHLIALHRQYGFPVMFTRTVNVYGPGQQLYRLIPKTVLSIAQGLRLKLHGGGASKRSFIHIRDFAEAALRIATAGTAGETYHIATPAMITIRGLVEKVCQRMGVALEDAVEDVAERPGKDPVYWLDDSKLRARLAWQEQITLDEGLDETVDWFVERIPELTARSLEYEHRP